MSKSNSITIGVSAKSGRPVSVPYNDLLGHVLISGRISSGKTPLSESMIGQHIANGGGCFIVGMNNAGRLDSVIEHTKNAGRLDDILIINPAEPIDTYNPIENGTPQEIASRILACLPNNTAGVSCYSDQIYHGLSAVIGALRKSSIRYTLADLSRLILSPGELLELEMNTPDSIEKENLVLFLDMFCRDHRGNTCVDSSRLEEVFGGIVGVMTSLTIGEFAEITNSPVSDVNLFDAMNSGKIVYVSFPQFNHSFPREMEVSYRFILMVIEDLRAAMNRMSLVHLDHRPALPFYCSFDDIMSYGHRSWSNIFAQARAANCIISITANSASLLDEIFIDGKGLVLKNTAVKLTFNQSMRHDADVFSRLIKVAEPDSAQKKVQRFIQRLTGDVIPVAENHSQFAEIHDLGLGEVAVSVNNEYFDTVKVCLDAIKSPELSSRPAIFVS